MKISLITPVFNSEKTIARLLNILKNQMNYDCEMILVDDCSKDNSLSICKAFSAEVTNVVVLEQKRQVGCAAARQLALDVARGDYIIFLDADDLVEYDFMEEIRSIIDGNDDIDFFVYGHKTQSNTGCDIYMNDEGVYNAEDFFKKVLWDEIKGPYALWTHIYKKEYLKKRGIKFVETLRKASDEVFNDECMMGNPKVLVSSKVLYTWVRDHESLTNRFEPSMLDAKKIHISNMIELIKRYCDTEESYKMLYETNWYAFRYIFSNIYSSDLDKKEKKYYYKKALDENIDIKVVCESTKGLQRVLLSNAIKYNEPVYLLIWQKINEFSYKAILGRIKKSIKGCLNRK